MIRKLLLCFLGVFCFFYKLTFSISPLTTIPKLEITISTETIYASAWKSITSEEIQKRFTVKPLEDVKKVWIKDDKALIMILSYLVEEQEKMLLDTTRLMNIDYEFLASKGDVNECVASREIGKNKIKASFCTAKGWGQTIGSLKSNSNAIVKVIMIEVPKIPPKEKGVPRVITIFYSAPLNEDAKYYPDFEKFLDSIDFGDFEPIPEPKKSDTKPTPEKEKQTTPKTPEPALQTPPASTPNDDKMGQQILDAVKNLTTEYKEGFGSLKSDVNSLKSNVQEIRTDVDTLKNKVQEIEKVNTQKPETPPKKNKKDETTPATDE